MNTEKEKKVSTVKIAFWYTFSTILTKGLAALTTPVFSRLLTKAEYGGFSNFTSWLNLLTIICTLDLYQSVLRAKYDYEEKLDEFLSSILFVSNMATMFFWIVVEYNSSLFCNVFSMEIHYVRIMFVYMLLEPAFTFTQIKHRAYKKYKLFVLYSVLLAVVRTGASIILVVVMEDGLKARTLGYIVPALLLFLYISCGVYFRGRCIKGEYIRYALALSIPMLVSTLSGNILTSSDRIMIEYYIDSEATAVYTLTYQVSTLITMFTAAINQAWTPWLYDELNEKRYSFIKKYSLIYVGGFAALVLVIQLLGPEILYIMGGKNYIDASNLMPPIITGLFCHFVYTLYVHVEMYEKKAVLISLGTGIAAIVNLVLNMIYIPKYGYVAAAYTTLIGYCVLLAYHCAIVNYKLKKGFLYDNRKIVLIVLGVIASQEIVLLLYLNTMIRYFILTGITIAGVVIVLKYRKQLMGLVNKIKN